MEYIDDDQWRKHDSDPSLYEGFGLPVITSNRISLPEVAGAAAVYIDLDNLSGHTCQMIRLIEGERAWKTCKERGLKRPLPNYMAALC